jgi:hypothetical protein
MNDHPVNHPDTPIWCELRRQAACRGVLDITLRTTRARSANDPHIVDLTWPGGETESLRFQASGDLDALAHALAHELRITLAPPRKRN